MIGLSNLTVSKTLTEIENIPCQNVLANEENTTKPIGIWRGANFELLFQNVKNSSFFL